MGRRDDERRTREKRREGRMRGKRRGEERSGCEEEGRCGEEKEERMS